MKLLNWFRRRTLESDLDHELDYHVDRRVNDLLRAGLPEGGGRDGRPRSSSAASRRFRRKSATFGWLDGFATSPMTCASRYDLFSVVLCLL